MEVKNAPRPVAAQPVSAPVAPRPEALLPAAAPSRDGFAAAAPAQAETAQPLPESAAAAELWGAPQTATDRAAAAAARPSFEGISVGNRHGQPVLEFTVKKGDTLSALSRASGVDVGSLTRLNHLENPNLIQVGQKIEVPTTFHEVKKGDTYYGIARQSGIPPQVLMKLNNAPPDGLLRIGQEIRVPASVVGPAQQQLRAQLTSVIDDAARANSNLYFGADSFRPWHVGNDLGFMGPADTDSRFEFSADFQTVKITHGQGDEPPAVHKLQNPVEDLRRIVNTDTVGAVARAQAQRLKEQFPDFEHGFNVVGPKHEQDGTVSFVITAPADGETYLSYDPRKATVTISDNSDREVTVKAHQPTDIVSGLSKHFRLQLPLYA